VVVRDGDLSLGIDPHSNGIIGDAFSSDLFEEVPFITEDFDTVSSVVANENLLLIIDHHAVGKMKVLGTSELLEKSSIFVKDDDPHDLTLHYYDPALVVDAHAARMLQDIGSKLPHKLPVLRVDLDLVGWRPFCDNDISRVLEDCHPVGIEKLAVSLSHLTELELEPTLLVENLYLVVVGVSHDNVVLVVDRHSTWLRELIFQDSELPELAVVDHLLTLDVGLGGGRIYHRSHISGRSELWRQTREGIELWRQTREGIERTTVNV